MFGRGMGLFRRSRIILSFWLSNLSTLAPPRPKPERERSLPETSGLPPESAASLLTGSISRFEVLGSRSPTEMRDRDARDILTSRSAHVSYHSGYALRNGEAANTGYNDSASSGCPVLVRAIAKLL